jgi:hypothetical protein
MGRAGHRRAIRGRGRSGPSLRARPPSRAHAGEHSHATRSGRGVSVSGRHLHCAAIRCGTSSIRQWPPTCAMVMARPQCKQRDEPGDEEALWPSGRRPATDLGPQDLLGRRVARCAVSRRRVVVRAVGRYPARWPRGLDEHLSSSGIDDRDVAGRRWSRRAPAKSSDPEAEQGDGVG